MNLKQHTYTFIFILISQIKYLQLKKSSTHLHTHTYTHTYVHTYTHTYAHTYTHLYTHTHIILVSDIRIPSGISRYDKHEESAAAVLCLVSEFSSKCFR